MSVLIPLTSQITHKTAKQSIDFAMIETPRQGSSHQEVRLPATEALAMSLEFTQTQLRKPSNDDDFDIGSLLQTISESTNTVGIFPDTKATATELFPSIEWNIGRSEESTAFSPQTRRKQRLHRKLQRRKRHRTGGLVRSQPLLCLTSAAFDEPHQVSDDEAEPGETSKKRLKMSVLSPLDHVVLSKNSNCPSTTYHRKNPLRNVSQQKQSQKHSYDTVVGATCTLLPFAHTPHHRIEPTWERASLLCDCPFPSCP